MELKEFGDITVFKINDLKCIDVLEANLSTKGEMFPIYGPNGAGKSTVIGALEMLFNGGKLPEGLIRKGKKEALIEALTSTGVTARKRIRTTKKGKQVSEVALFKDNQEISAPQDVLKQLFGGLVSPNKMANATGAALFKGIIDAAGISTTKQDEKISNQKVDIAVVTREIKVMGERVAPPDLPEGIEDLDPYDADEFVRVFNLVKSCNDASVSAAGTRQRIETGKLKLKEIQDKILELETMATKFDIEAERLPAAQARMKEVNLAKANDELIKEVKSFKSWEKEKSDKQKGLKKKKEILKAEELRRKETLTEADTGVLGLKLTDDGGVLFNGIPWENLCYSDRMKIATILTIKGMDKDRVNIMFLEHGESLSAAKRKEIAEACKEFNVKLFLEVFVETVAQAGDDGITLQAVDQMALPDPKEEVSAEGSIDVDPIVKPKQIGKAIPQKILDDVQPIDVNPFANIDDGLGF